MTSAAFRLSLGLPTHFPAADSYRPATAVANIVAATIVAIPDLRILTISLTLQFRGTPRMMRGFRMQLDF
jgi:hypothetical protein